MFHIPAHLNTAHPAGQICNPVGTQRPVPMQRPMPTDLLDMLDYAIQCLEAGDQVGTRRITRRIAQVAGQSVN